MQITDKMLKSSQVAALAHREQEYNGKPYIEHPARVYHRIWDMGYEDEDIFCVAKLHDVVEDTYVTLDEIREQFGDRVADAVDAISRRKIRLPRRNMEQEQVEFTKEPEEFYLARVTANEIASIVKHADMIDNLLMTRAVGVSPQKRLLHKKYVNAIRVIATEYDHKMWMADPDNQPNPMKTPEV